jgi:hypothetical protein
MHRKREVIIYKNESDIFLHTLIEIIHIINLILKSNKIVAIQRLQSKNILIIFNEKAKIYKIDNTWITEIFKIIMFYAYREFIIIA